MTRNLTRLQMIERSISKKFRKELWAPFLTAINRYKLIDEGDRIAVCISGGKDSMCMAKLFQMLMRHSDIHFETVFLLMDPGYSQTTRDKIKENASLLEIPLTEFKTQIFAIADTQSKSPCYLCARMRRGSLYAKARELSCNKIALGHHLNDAIETTLMSMFYSSKLETIIPKSHSENFPDMELIRPMYCVKEADINAWCAYNDLSFIQCACSVSARNNDSPNASKRHETKLLIAELKKNNPEIEENIFRSLHAVYLDSFPGYKKDGILHNFNEIYEGKDK